MSDPIGQLEGLAKRLGVCLNDAATLASVARTTINRAKRSGTMQTKTFARLTLALQLLGRAHRGS
jgi:hypothetical protein